ncbi:ABC transporter ATP-binding protein [Candidatus Campbellbacteria bacterium CG22_combo_CG10-13_8_21_14_all_43_18]|uniref:ABC transporter ATP-binding protein n=1 Tax=Candidatus Campbellbacteria bacterium CG22_combo_CG10-13_8_21_14_all_43_18 TaxID=1974530 RepID=A0A2H0DX21_9BACT|nr:MAG: ABC transporter ATP-binding protein [Candidatus Campbellbacteria bacterium CG22_combo_CG10-13_8_21_14_all_43_18]
MVIFENISKSFKSKNDNTLIGVVDNLSFEVEKGEFFCIVGPSGCGKSTIINLIAGFLKPENGRVLIDDCLVTKPSPKRTVVFQDHILFPWKTVAQNIEFGLKFKIPEKIQRKERVDFFLEKFRLEKFANYYPFEISGGMKQKAALARASAVEPKIILMDEPLASLDQQTRDLLQEELIKFKNEFSQTIIFVTHNIEEALFLGDRILVLTQRPAKFKTIINNPFPNPRNPDIRNKTDFINMKHKIWHLLREEII